MYLFYFKKASPEAKKSCLGADKLMILSNYVINGREFRLVNPMGTSNFFVLRLLKNNFLNKNRQPDAESKLPKYAEC